MTAIFGAGRAAVGTLSISAGDPLTTWMPPEVSAAKAWLSNAGMAKATVSNRVQTTPIDHFPQRFEHPQCS